MAQSDIEKILSALYENYVCVKEVHEKAYELNSEYRVFWDRHSDEEKKRFISSQRAMSVSNGVGKFREGLFHASTFGLSYLVKKAVNRKKPSKDQAIIDAVTNSEFTELLQTLNTFIRVPE